MRNHFARALTLLLAAASLRAQTATLTVQVRDAVTKAPLPNVNLKLERIGETPATQTAQTGGDGNAGFENLASGRFHLTYNLEGYVDSQGTDNGRRVRLQDGAVKETLTIDLMPAGTLEGTVRDEDGEPMPGVMVFTSGDPRGASDHEGRFRMEHLLPGAYRIQFKVPDDLRKKTLKRDPETGETFGYPLSEYYPGVEDARAATAVQVAGGFGLHGYDVRLRRVRQTEFSGRVLASVGESLAGARVELQPMPRTPGVLDTNLAPRAVSGDGAFHFELIQPGSYALLVYRSEAAGALPYILPVEVGRTGLEKDVVVPPQQRIEGTVKVKGGDQWGGQVSLMLMPGLGGTPTRTVTLTGEKFVLEDVPSGKWHVVLYSNAVRRPDYGKLSVTAARFGVENAMTGSFTVTESGNPPLEIELSNETGRIAGTIEGKDRGLVFLRRVGADFVPPIRPIEPKEDGSFLVEDLPPGAYEVIMWINGSAGKAPRAQAEVKSGDTAVVRLEVK